VGFLPTALQEPSAALRAIERHVGSSSRLASEVEKHCYFFWGGTGMPGFSR
jgi:hypothetical protein